MEGRYRYRLCADTTSRTIENDGQKQGELNFRLVNTHILAHDRFVSIGMIIRPLALTLS